MLLSPLGLTNLRQVEALVDPHDFEGEPLRDYMAPEQRGGATPDARSDLYSLGLLLLEMIGGAVHAPLPHHSRSGTASRIPSASKQTGPARPFVPVIPPGLPSPWREFLAKAIALTPEDRFATADEFVAALPAEQPVPKV
jgi:serine/threonine-protein kinase